MKNQNTHKYILALAVLLWAAIPPAIGQDEQAVQEEQPEKVIKLRYFNQDNSIHYLLLESQLKTGKKVQPRPNAAVRIYLDSVSDQNLMQRTSTGNIGKVKAFLPPSLADAWKAAATHEFIAVEEPVSNEGEETRYTVSIQKARLAIDTGSDEGVRSITVTAMKYEGEEWVPAVEMELRVGVARQGGLLNAGSDDTYTTDSSGMVTVEFDKDSLPGDEKGTIILVARADDNEYHGTLVSKKAVPWGVAFTPNADYFNRRTLWSTSAHAPIWLMLLAYSIIAAVWGVLLYLVYQLVKVIRLGRGKMVEGAVKN